MLVRHTRPQSPRQRAFKSGLCEGTFSFHRIPWIKRRSGVSLVNGVIRTRGSTWFQWCIFIKMPYFRGWFVVCVWGGGAFRFVWVKWIQIGDGVEGGCYFLRIASKGWVCHLIYLNELDGLRES